MNNAMKRFFLSPFNNTSNNNVNNNGKSVTDHSRIVNANTILGNKIGFVLVSLGVLLAASSGSWDITNHLLNKPESFFSPPHAGLYVGVAIVVFALIWILRYSRKSPLGHIDYSIIHVINTGTDQRKPPLALATKLIITGVTLLAVAGPFDFAWHSAFGLDGLLSPSHFTLAMGMVLSSTGALLGILSTNELDSLHDMKIKTKSITTFINSNIRGSSHLDCYKLSLLIVLAILPAWITLVGLTHMLSLPFSDTEVFKFNPDPTLAAIFVTLALPFLVSFMLTASFRLTRKFGIITITGSAFMIINLVTSILPNEYLLSTVPFYVLNLIAFLAADLTLSKLVTSRYEIFIYGISGAIFGVTFFMLHYPLITYTYNEVLPNSEPVWPSVTIATYFGMVGKIYPIVMLPALTSGVFGAILGLGLRPTQR
jgi:hypothetical protein